MVRTIEVRALRKLRDPSSIKEFSYNYDNNDMLTDDERKKIDILKGNIYASNLIFRNNSHISPNDRNSIEILKAFIKDLKQKIQERKMQIKSQIDPLDYTIEELDLSVRTFNVLKRAGVKTLGAISQLTEKELMRIRNFGKNSYNEIVQKLGEYGLTLSENTNPENDTQIESQIDPLDYTIKELGLSTRAFNALYRAGIDTLRDISQSTKEELMEIRHLGKNSYSEIVQKLGEYGLTLRKDAEPEQEGEEKSNVIHQSSDDDTFIQDVLENAARRADLRKQSEQAKELAEKYEKAYGKMSSKGQHSFDDNSDK